MRAVRRRIRGRTEGSRNTHHANRSGVAAMEDPVDRKSFERTRSLSGTFEIDGKAGVITEIVRSNGKSGTINWDVTDFVPMALWEMHGMPANRVFLEDARIEIEVRVTATFAALQD